MKNKPDSLFFTQLFVSEPQTAFIAAEKPHTRFFGAVPPQNTLRYGGIYVGFGKDKRRDR